MSSEDEYRGTTRTLDVLRALNEQNGASVLQLSRRTGISRAALYRILSALQQGGYIRRRDEDGAIFLTGLIQSLSSGYKDEFWISEIAGPILDELQRRVVWPTDLGIFHNYAIKLAFTTRAHSPLVIDRGFAGIEMPIFPTSLGQAYIAFCAPPERLAIIEHLARVPDSVDAKIVSHKARTKNLLQEVRARGYGARYRNSYDETRYPGIINDSASIAVPIRRDRYSVAALGITFIASALSIGEAAEKHLKDMQDAAAAIGRELAKSTRLPLGSSNPGPVAARRPRRISRSRTVAPIE